MAIKCGVSDYDFATCNGCGIAIFLTSGETMPVAQTSKHALKFIKDNGITDNQMKAIIYVLMASDEPMTRREIAVAAHMEPSAVGGRVATLIEKDLLCDLPKRKCKVKYKEKYSPRKVKTVDLKFRHKRPEEYLFL